MRQRFGEYYDHDDGPHLVGEDRTDEYAEPHRRLPAVLLTVLAMALFAGGLWFAYVQGTHHPAILTGDSAKLIRADDRPTKMKPEQPGGMAIPDQNVSLYNDRPGAAPVERLLPAAEQPLPRPALPPPKEAAVPLLEPPGAPPAAAVSAAAPPAAHPAAKTVAKPIPAKAPALPKQAATAPAGKAPVQLQLGSLRSPDAAREQWAKLKRENPDLLGKLSAVAVRVDMGDKGIYYRIQAGSFGEPAAAEKLCGELKRRNLGCIIVR